MASIRFLPSGYESTIAPGTKVIDLTDDEPRAEIPYSCRSASCGTCRVAVLEGADAFPAPEDDELHVLDLMLSPEGVRLACQLKCVRDVPRIVLEVAPEEF